MRVPWIRVHGALIDKPVVTRLAEAVKVSRLEAAGLLVTFWGAVSQHCANGQVAHYSDAQIEAWAHWTRRRGAFAKWLRDHHLDDDGRVREWDEYAGKLEVIRERDRQRKAAKCPAERDRNSSGKPSELLDVSTPARANETKRDETKDLKPSRSAKKPAETPETGGWPAALAAHWTEHIGDVDPGRVGKRLKRIVDKFGLPPVLAAVVAYSDEPMGTRPRTLEDFASNFQRWRKESEIPIVQDGVITPRGERITRPGAIA